MTDKVTARILVISLTILAAIGLVGTLWLLAVKTDANQVSVFVALAGVPIGAVAALATTRNSGASTGSTEASQGLPGPTYETPDAMTNAVNISNDPLLDELSSDSIIIPGA